MKIKSNTIDITHTFINLGTGIQSLYSTILLLDSPYFLFFLLQFPIHREEQFTEVLTAIKA